MEAIIINKENRESAINRAIARLHSGGIIIAKADTSYAILANPLSAKALKELSKIKDSRGSKKFSHFVLSKKDVLDTTDDKHKVFVSNLIPGCVTIVTNKNKPALRYINQKTIREILRGFNSNLTATSANPSGLDPARDLDMLREYFSSKNILVIYEGPVSETLSSTIIDVTGSKPKVLRQGKVQI